MSEIATTNGTPLLEVQNVSRYFGSVIALKDISMSVHAGEVMCLLGDNGAGKSTLIKIFSGVYPPSEGSLSGRGNEVHFSSPREALAAGIATVYQDLAMIPLMSISRNFFLGSEPTKGWGPFRHFDVETADRIRPDELHKMGIQVRDTGQSVGTLSGGERQSCRACGLLRRQGADPRRADGRPRGQGSRGGAALHRAGARADSASSSSPQRASRLPGRRSFYAAEPGTVRTAHSPRTRSAAKKWCA